MPTRRFRVRQLLNRRGGLIDCGDVRYWHLADMRLVHCTCPLSGVKRTCRFALHMSAFDPKRTSRLPVDVSVLRYPQQRGV